MKKQIILESKSGKIKFFSRLYEYRILLLMLLPAVIYFFIFSYLPMAGIVLAFEKYDYSLGMFKSPFVGLENFEFFFKSGQAFVVTRNTFLYNIAFMLISNVMELITAVFLAEVGSKFFRKISQTCIFFPYFISWVVVGAFTYSLFSYDYGVVNSILKDLSLEPINIYATPGYWPFIIVILNTWKSLGYGTVVYMATITGIDTSIYEAAEIDGAGILQRVRYITIPSLRSTMITLILLAMGHVFRGNFNEFYQLVGTNGLLYNATDVIDTFTFRTLMFSSDIGMSSAVGLYQSVLCFIFIIIVNTIVKKVDQDSALF